MRKKRSRKDYGGGGGGKRHFEGKIFDVTIWKLQHGTRTTINCTDSLGPEIHFDGEHFDLNSDKACMKQFTGTEILRIMTYREEEAFKKGERSKINEIKSVLRVG
ncbi:MAG: hypothetical protein ACTSYQ_00450 [Candidatus Odinarchaeia archaeon]